MDIRSRPRVINSTTGTKDLQMVSLLLFMNFDKNNSDYYF